METEVSITCPLQRPWRTSQAR